MAVVAAALRKVAALGCLPGEVRTLLGNVISGGGENNFSNPGFARPLDEARIKTTLPHEIVEGERGRRVLRIWPGRPKGEPNPGEQVLWNVSAFSMTENLGAGYYMVSARVRSTAKAARGAGFCYNTQRRMTSRRKQKRKKEMKRLFAVVGLAAAVAGCCTGKCNCPKDSGTTFARDALQKYVDSGEMPGAISVFYKDGVQETACIGYADIEKKRPITLDDVYMQCSQTKGFCGVTIAQLVEEGKITLDDPVSKYLPEFKELWIKESSTNGVQKLVKAKNVLTVRNVMNHTGGFPFELPNGIAMGGWSRRMPLRSVAATAASQPILFEPGTSVQYSNVGIDIGAAVVEVVTGKRWEQVLQERVFDPLGMKDSGFWPTDEQLAHKIELYDVKGGEKAKWKKQADWMQRPYNDDRVFSSAGAGLWTTARDQLKFYKMLMNLGVGENGVRILKEETVKSILAASTRPANLKDPNYSLGLRAPIKDTEDEWFGHGGAWGTNCQVNWHKKQLKLWVVQFCGSPRPWDADRKKAADEFFKAKIDNSGADAYTGRMK